MGGELGRYTLGAESFACVENILFMISIIFGFLDAVLFVCFVLLNESHWLVSYIYG